MILKRLVLIGAGGHSKSIIDSLGNEFDFIGYVDENKTGFFYGKPIFGQKISDVPNYESCVFFVSIGDNRVRTIWYERILSLGLSTVNIIDKSAYISPTASIGNGNFIGKNAVINADSIIGNNNIINTRALVEHECVVGNNIHLSTGAILNGNVKVEDGAFLGSMSVCIGQLTIGKGTIIGAGGVVTSNVPSNVTAVGVPVKIIKEHRE